MDRRRKTLLQFAFILLCGDILVNCKVITHRVQSDNEVDNNDLVWHLKVNLKNTSSSDLLNSSSHSSSSSFSFNEPEISLANDT